MPTKNEAKTDGKDNLKNAIPPDAKDLAGFLSPETIAGCVEVGGKAATPAEAARLTAGCLMEHLRIAKAQQSSPPKDPGAPQT